MLLLSSLHWRLNFLFFFFNDTATTEIYTLSLHDALPISVGRVRQLGITTMPVLKTTSPATAAGDPNIRPANTDRKSTRLNSSHSQISYAVFCLKKKKKESQKYYWRHTQAPTSNEIAHVHT